MRLRDELLDLKECTGALPRRAGGTIRRDPGSGTMESVAHMAGIVSKGGRPHLEADDKLTPADFADIAREIGRKPVRARKVGYIAARKAARPETVETRWNGKETTNTAKPGDYVVTNLSPQRQPLRDAEGHLNTYVISAARFRELYEAEGEDSELGPVYRAKSVVSALRLPGGFDIIAPWGERQRGADGYLLMNGEEIYGAGTDAFEATYEVIG
jgi:hypothetical protein